MVIVITKENPTSKYKQNNNSKVGNPDSKYFGNPKQFDIDMQNHIDKREKDKQEIKQFLENKITQSYYHEDNYKLIIESLIELREKYDIY